MYEGITNDKLYLEDSRRVDKLIPQSTSGTYEGTESIYRYSLRSSEYPTLVLCEAIKDEDGDVIPPGHYELALSDNRDLLLLMQSKNLRAIIPVLSIEEDASEEDRVNDRKYKKELKAEAKVREKINEKRGKVAMTPDEPSIFMEASIEYVEDGGYYLIKYQRETIRAWGAFRGK